MVIGRSSFIGEYQVSGYELTFSGHWQGSVKGMRLGVLDVGSNTVHLLVVDAYRGARPMPAFSHKVNLKLANQLDAPNPERVVESKETRREVREALARLPRKPAAVLTLRYSGLSYAEVAEALGVGVGQVGTLLRRAEAALRKEVIRGSSV